MSQLKDPWSELRQSRPTRYEMILNAALIRAGIQFKSQFRIAIPRELRKTGDVPGYVLDFLIERKLDVEVDGLIHEEPDVKKRDKARDSTLRKMGYRVMRIPNETVATHTDQTIDSIRRDLDLYRVE